MQTILYQGRPREGGDWLALTPEFVDCVREIGYETRELVLREEAEQAKVEQFNAGIEQAAQLAEGYSVATKDLAAKIRELKVPQGAKPVDDVLLVDISRTAP